MVNKVLDFICQQRSVNDNKQFFNSAIEFLCILSQQKYGAISFVNNGQIYPTKTLAHYSNDKVIVDQNCILKSTLLSDIKDNHFIYIPQNAYAYFQQFNEFNSDIESLVGIKLTDTENNTIGLLYMLNDKPLSNVYEIEQVLKIIEPRLSHLLENLTLKGSSLNWNEKFKNLLDNSNDIFYQTTLEGKITYISPSVEKFSGYKVEDVIGRQVSELVQISRSSLRHLLNDLNFNGKVLDIDIKTTKSDGSYWWGSANAYFLTDIVGNRTSIEGLVRDVSSLKLSEQRYQVLSNAAFEGICMHNKGILTDFNERFAQLLNYERDELIGKSIFDVITEESKADVIYHTQNKLTDAYEIQGLRKDGSTFPAEIRGHQLSHMGESVRITVVRDLTKYKLSKQKLVESERSYKDLLELAPDGFFHGDTKGNIIAINGKTITLTGYEKDELLKMNLRDLFSASILNLKPLRYDLLLLGQTVITEREITKKDGSALIVEMNSKQMPDGTYISLFRDISTRKAEQQALVESEERYKKTFLTSPDAITITQLDGTFVDVNESFETLTCYNKDEVIGKNSQEIKIWSSNDKRNFFLRQLREFGTINNLEVEFISKKGTVLYGLLSGAIIKLNGIDHVISITRDITQRKKLQDELVSEKLKAIESDRLKTEFLNNMSHEIRTPLNAILGFSKLISEEGLDEKIKDEYIEIINVSGNQLLTIISDIIDISQLEVGQIKLNIKPCNINKILDDLNLQFREKTDSSIILKMTKGLPDIDSIINIDQARLIQVLTNLLVNAKKFTPKGSIEFGYQLNHNNQLIFFVKDTGIGISKLHHEHIFERFRQAEGIGLKVKSGTGLGLAISRALVELFGGEIWVESEVGKGADFYFTIPYNKTIIQENKNQTNSIDKTISFNNLTILIAEDEDVNFLYLKRLLDLNNCRILHAKNGFEAVEIVKQVPQIDIVLMDIKMPIMDGLEATKLIKELFPYLPIVAQSAFAMKTDINTAKDAGCDDYLAKPISKNSLYNCIQRITVSQI